MASPTPPAASGEFSGAGPDEETNTVSMSDLVASDPDFPERDTYQQNKIEGRRLRIKLRFFFMNPYDKFCITGQLPWKLIIQIVKIVVVTTQLLLFGALRMEHVEFIEATETVLRHIVLRNWTDVRDVVAWPPPSGPYAVYTVGGLDQAMATVVLEYYQLNQTTFSSMGYVYPLHDAKAKADYPPMEIVYDKYKKADFFPENSSYFIDTTQEIIKVPLHLSLAERTAVGEDPEKIREVLEAAVGADLLYTEMQTLSFNFKLQMMRMSPFSWSTKPACFVVKVGVIFDNRAHTGMVDISLNADFDYAHRCSDAEHTYTPTAINRAYGSMVFTIVVDVIVIACSSSSLILCGRALLRAELLKRRTAKYFRSVLNYELANSERLEFVNLWYWMIVINDIFILIGTLFKISIEYKYFNNEYFTATGIFMGVGTLLVWTGILRYLGFFSRYNVLILTLKRALPNVLRFLVCCAILYAGFMLCGWIVLGPYSNKFRTMFISFACMYALINGDDMFATFVTLRSRTPSAVLVFAKCYLVIFISLFMYVVLSLFISIIMDAYEVVKEHHDSSKNNETFLTEFIRDRDGDDNNTPYDFDKDHYDLPLDCDCTRVGLSRAWARLTQRPSRDAYEEIDGENARTS